MTRTLLTLTLCIALLGCAAKKPIVGAANQFDSDSYLVLVTTDTVIQSSKAALAANSFPASIVPAVKSALNNLIATYDGADTVYLAYHTSALAGTATPAQQSTVSAALSAMQTATTNLVTVQGGK